MSPNLDVLRAIAVLLVLIGHTLGHFVPTVWTEPLARCGVFLFFVHTCYVLMQSLERQMREQPVGLAWRFYVRRLFRIYPLAVVTLLAVLLVTAWAGAPWPEPESAGQVVSNLTLTTNVAGYRNLIPVYWTLPIELQMYACLPVLFLLARRRATLALGALWLLSAAVGLAALYLLPDGIQHRLQLLQYVPHFLPGVLGYSIAARPRLNGAWWPATIILLVLSFSAIDIEPLYWLLALAIGLSLRQFRSITGPMAVGAHVIAKYSYGIYLWHFVAYWITEPFGITGWIEWPCIVAGLAFASYHLIEQPMIAVGVRLASGLRLRAADVPAGPSVP